MAGLVEGGGPGTRGDSSGEQRGLRFQMLGPVQVRRDGEPVKLGGPQQRAVLALLLIDSDPPVPITRLATELWGDRPPPGSAATIQTYVFHLREALEPDRARGAPARVLVTDRGGYRLALDDAAVDAYEFEVAAHAGIAHARDGEDERALGELEPALALWRGDVLADVAELPAVAPVAARLTELRVAAIEARVDALLALGRHELVIGELDELITLHPLHERLHAQRMIALYRCGRQADALASYPRLRRLLAEEIGVEPSPQLQQLHAAILAHDPALAPDSALRTRSPVQQAAERPWFRRRRWSIAATTAAACLAAVVVTTALVTRDQPRPGSLTISGNTVGIIDADGGQHDVVRVGANPTALVASAGAVWVANGGAGTVSRIDPLSALVIDQIPVGDDPVAITATGRDVWVVSGADGTVDRINTTVDRVVGTPIKVGNQPLAIASGPSGIWVANAGDDTIQRIDPYSGHAGEPIPVGERPDGIAVGADTVWVANQQDGTVSRVDLHSRATAPPVRVGAGPGALALVGGSVWVANTLEQSVSRIDTSSGAVRTVTGVGDEPSALVGTGRYIWAAVAHSGAVARIDPDGGAVRRFRIRGSPVALAGAGSRVYVAAQTFASAAHVGGTLRIGEVYLPGAVTGIDPANVYDFWTGVPQLYVYDGLVRYRQADGLAGYTLVPNLAARMPTVSPDGRTYTFALRTGIRYATGRVVTAGDFARGFRRVFTVGGGGNPALFRLVVGAGACLAHPTRCDLTNGVIADDPRHQLTVRLTGRDPDLLGKLTYFVYPTPPGIPDRQLTTPLPGTGPYRIAGLHHQRDRTGRITETTFDTLVRNRYFRQWSVAAQPAGYPDVMTWRAYRTARDAMLAVRAGKIDIGGRRFIGDTASLGPLLADLRLHHPERLHAQLLPGLVWEALNTQVPPFNNRLARQAVNYAVDRNRLAGELYGPGLTQPSCQMLPANFPAYAPYCPFTRPGPAVYNGPDLAKARRLVARSGTRGARVAVHQEIVTPNNRAVLDEIVNALRAIGYRVSVRVVPCRYATACLTYRPRNNVQVSGLDGWIADYPAPDTFFDPLISCRVRNERLTGFCDPRIDRLAADARRAELIDPSVARRLWTQVDRLVTDAAPWIMIGGAVGYQLTSARVGNYQQGLYGPIHSQLWVR